LFPVHEAGEFHALHAIHDLKSEKHRSEVAFHRTQRNAQIVGNLLVLATLQKQSDDLLLHRSEAVFVALWVCHRYHPVQTYRIVSVFTPLVSVKVTAEPLV
jgi:hypothetical protein